MKKPNDKVNEAPLNPEDFRISPEEMAALKKPITNKGKPRTKPKILFYLFPTELMRALLEMNYPPVFALVLVIYRAWYRGFDKRSPVKLTSTLLKKLGVSRGQKRRAIRLLEQNDLFIVERRPGCNPTVSIKWNWSFGPFKKKRLPEGVNCPGLAEKEED